MTLPQATSPFFAFARRLRRHGFAIAPEQAITFLAAIALLGPRAMDDIRQAALATLAPPPDRRAEFDGHFEAHFYGAASAMAPGDAQEETQIHDNGAPREAELATARQEEGGAITSATERLGIRSFPTAASLAHFSRTLPEALPQRRPFRSRPTPSGGRIDLRRALRDIVRTDGDLPRPPRHSRRTEPRKLLILIDISGSMRLHTQDHLRLAHAAVQGCDRVEVFTLGTRLTRLTQALRLHDPARALAQAAASVADWDGGTRIGPTLLAFLAIPRFAAFARGAAVVILSDALERGDPAAMAMAFRRLAARAFRLSLCTPLAADPRFRPATAALSVILPYLDDLADGASTATLTDFILRLGRPAPAAATVWNPP